VAKGSKKEPKIYQEENDFAEPKVDAMEIDSPKYTPTDALEYNPDILS
jgi:hypothetical protein